MRRTKLFVVELAKRATARRVVLPRPVPRVAPAGSAQVGPPQPPAAAPAWKLRLVELAGAVLLIWGVVAPVMCTFAVFFVEAPAGLVGIPIGASSVAILPLGWRLLMHPERPP